MKVQPILLLLLSFSFGSCQQNIEQRSQSTYAVTFYPKTEDISAEFGTCEHYPAQALSDRHREYEYKGLPYGHAVLDGVEHKSWVVPKNPLETRNLQTQEFFKNAYKHFIETLKNPSVPTLSDADLVTFRFKDSEFKQLISFNYETKGKLYQFRVDGQSISPVVVDDRHGIDIRQSARLVDFQMKRDASRGHKGLNYLYIYSGEILVKNELIAAQKESYRVLLAQSFLPTHFVDPYEMKRDFPQVVGKIHNIETIQDKLDEQNVLFFHISVSASPSSTSGFTSFKFQIPLLIHTTVLPPQVGSSTLETYIPQNAKVYVNFLKPTPQTQISFSRTPSYRLVVESLIFWVSQTQSLRGRFASDCLVPSEFLPVSSAKSESPNQIPVKEQRLVLDRRDSQNNRAVLGAGLAVGLVFVLLAVLRRG